RERADEESLVFRQPVCGTESQPVRPEWAVGSNLQLDANAVPRFDGNRLAVRSRHALDYLNRFDRNSRLVEENLARLLHVAAEELNFDRRAALPAGRRQACQFRRTCRGTCRGNEKRDAAECYAERSHRVVPGGAEVSRGGSVWRSDGVDAN